MCGIIYKHNLRGKNVVPKLLRRYSQQRSRGHEGFGVYLPERDTLIHHPKEGRMLKTLRRIDSSIVLFHHRQPTSTDNVRNACHPFSTKDFFDTNYVLVHNGWLTNEDELKEEHKKLGIKYVSNQPNKEFNDSEALLWDVALYLEGKQSELKAKGKIAFICYATNGEDRKLYFARNVSPLILNRGKQNLTLASEGEGEDIEPNRLYTYNYKTNRLTSKALTVPDYVSTYSQRALPPAYRWSDPEDEAGYTSPTSTLQPLADRAYKVAREYIDKAFGSLKQASETILSDLEIAQEGIFENITYHEIETLEAAGDYIINLWEEADYTDNALDEEWAE